MKTISPTHRDRGAEAADGEAGVGERDRVERGGFVGVPGHGGGVRGDQMVASGLTE